jgi:hypothetical protein
VWWLRSSHQISGEGSLWRLGDEGLDKKCTLSPNNIIGDYVRFLSRLNQSYLPVLADPVNDIRVYLVLNLERGSSHIGFIQIMCLSQRF